MLYFKRGIRRQCDVVRIIEPLTKVVDGKVVILSDEERKTESYSVDIHHLN